MPLAGGWRILLTLFGWNSKEWVPHSVGVRRVRKRECHCSESLGPEFFLRNNRPDSAPFENRKRVRHPHLGTEYENQNLARMRHPPFLPYNPRKPRRVISVIRENPPLSKGDGLLGSRSLAFCFSSL